MIAKKKCKVSEIGRQIKFPPQRSGKTGAASRESLPIIPIGSMYGIFTYIWLIFMVNVGKYTIHGSYGIVQRYPIPETNRHTVDGAELLHLGCCIKSV